MLILVIECIVKIRVRLTCLLEKDIQPSLGFEPGFSYN